MGIGLTYAVFFSDRGFRFGLKTIVSVVTCVCIFSATTKYVDIWLCLLFLAVTVPMANFFAVGALWGVIWYSKKTGNLWGKQKIEPYVGPVAQKPVDVVREQKRIEHRR